MDQNALELLQRSYAQSRETVMLLDKDWNVLWQNVMTPIGYIPQIAGILPESWEPCSRTIMLDGHSFALRIQGSETDGIRIATLSPDPLATLPMETEMITNAVHSVRAACTMLTDILEENEIYDAQDILNAISCNCLRLYRPAFLQKELERQQAGNWRHETFSARQQMEIIFTKTRKLLSRCARMELSLCEETTPLTGDLDAFSVAVLCALVLCYHDTLHRMEIGMELACSGDTCTITVSITPTPETRDHLRNMIGEFGSTYGEEKLLHLFCQQHGGSWMHGSTGNRHFCRITLPCSDENSITLRSPSAMAEDSFFNQYTILLGRIFPISHP